MPEHPSDDYLLVNSGIKISRVNCELGAEGFWKRSSGNTIGRGGLGGARRRRGENEREREKTKEKIRERRRRRRRRSVWPRLSLLFTLGSIAAWLWRLLQYRRGGNRPITCRLLICSTQTAAVLPPMRKTCVDPFAYSLSSSVYPLHHRSSISIPLGLMLRYSIVPLAPHSCPSRVLSFHPSFLLPTTLILLLSSPPFTSSSCCNYPLPLTASRTKHFLIGFRSERTVRPISFRKGSGCFCRFYRISMWLLSLCFLSFGRLFISSDSPWILFSIFSRSA